MASLGELLVKAVRGLPAEEQDAVLRQLLDRQAEAGPAAVHPPWSGGPWAELFTGRLLGRTAPERSGGSWQAVPVRLATEQHEELKQWCEANDFSMAVVIRGLVDRFLELQRRQPAP
ncbi:MAG TPA: hypothetical protein VLJ59_09950 [Mycobacteriales bacterium]|nr:hypothetical protein [Mycobacteriales bacterium]